MAWAIFYRAFNFDFRPDAAVSRMIEPSSIPTCQPERLIAAAVAAGAAMRVETPNAEQKRAYERAKRAIAPDTGQAPTI